MDYFVVDSLATYAVKQDLLILRLAENLMELERLVLVSLEK